MQFVGRILTNAVVTQKIYTVLKIRRDIFRISAHPR